MGELAELAPRIAYLFAPDGELAWDAEAEANSRKHPQAAQTLREYGDWLAARFAESRPPAELGEPTKAWVKECGLKIPALFQPLRCALTGQAGGPDLFQIMELLGPPHVLARIRRGAERLTA